MSPHIIGTCSEAPVLTSAMDSGAAFDVLTDCAITNTMHNSVRFRAPQPPPSSAMHICYGPCRFRIPLFPHDVYNGHALFESILPMFLKGTEVFFEFQAGQTTQILNRGELAIACRVVAANHNRLIGRPVECVEEELTRSTWAAGALNKADTAVEKPDRKFTVQIQADRNCTALLQADRNFTAVVQIGANGTLMVQTGPEEVARDKTEKKIPADTAWQLGEGHIRTPISMEEICGIPYAVPGDIPIRIMNQTGCDVLCAST